MKTNQKNLPTKKTGSSDGFTNEYQMVKGEITPILHRLFQKIEEKTLSNLFMRPA